MRSEIPLLEIPGENGLKNQKNKLNLVLQVFVRKRAIIITDSYNTNKREEPVIRRTKALRDILAKISIYILNNELIVGNQASKPLAAPFFPEYAVN